MKQGRASRDTRSGAYRDPRTKAVSPVAVDQLGAMQGNHTTSKGELGRQRESLFSGPGFRGPASMPQKAGPGGGRTIYPSGGQGKHGG